MNFKEKYGSWAVIAGASEGLGAEFARQLALRGLNLVLVARRADVLEHLRQDIALLGVHVRTVTADLARDNALSLVTVSTHDLEVGLLVYNAAFTPLGPFLEQSLADKLHAIDVNVRGPVSFAHHFGRAMAARKRGGVMLLSSLTAFGGTPYASTYGATKAFNLALAEGLWVELRASRVDVLSVCAGATATPNFLRATPNGAPGMLAPQAVVSNALHSLGRQPVTIPGLLNRVVSWVVRRWLSRRIAAVLVGGQTRKLQPTARLLRDGGHARERTLPSPTPQLPPADHEPRPRK